MLRRITASFIVLILCTGCTPKPQAGPADFFVPSATPVTETQALSPSPTATPTASPNVGINRDATTPVLIEGLLIGGLDHGEWIHYDEFYKSKIVNFDGFIYDVYMDDTYIGSAAGELPVSLYTGKPLKPDDDLSGSADVHLHDRDRQPVVYDLALQGDWDLYPRKYAEQSTDQEEYLAMVEDLLTQEGLAGPVTELKQVITVDLDGDGTDEMLAAADNTEDGQFEQIKEGDNALLVFRKIVDGQPVDQILDSYIVTEDPDYVTVYRILYAVQTCADLDGDGTLEVVVKSWYYEGVIYSIYKLIGDRLELVASNGVGF